MDKEKIDKVARAICRERCAFMGEPACWMITSIIKGEKFPAPDCDDPGCEALAMAALAAMEQKP
jgi:hypothetical protein